MDATATRGREDPTVEAIRAHVARERSLLGKNEEGDARIAQEDAKEGTSERASGRTSEPASEPDVGAPSKRYVVRGEVLEFDEPVYRIPLSAISVDPTWNVACGEITDASVQDLADEIEMDGLDSPIVVRPIERVAQLGIGPNVPNVEKPFAIIVGHRRFRAFELILLKRRAKRKVDAETWSAIPAFVRPMTEREARILNMRENVSQRKLEPQQIARAIVRLRVEEDMSFTEIAKHTCYSVARVSTLHRIERHLDPIIKRKEWDGPREARTLTEAELYTIARHPKESQIALYERMRDATKGRVDGRRWNGTRRGRGKDAGGKKKRSEKDAVPKKTIETILLKMPDARKIEGVGPLDGDAREAICRVLRWILGRGACPIAYGKR